MNKITNFLCLNLLLLGATVLGMNNPDEQLLDAAHGGDLDEVEILIAQGASVNAKNESRWTPLIYAAMRGYEAVCKLLIEKNASVEAKDNDGRTPLTWAARYDRMAVCKLLIANKASVEAKDNDGWTPLIWAARCGHDVVCMLLIDVQLEEARKSKAAIATFLGIVKKRRDNLPCHIHYDVAKIIARQAFESVQQDKQCVVAQIGKGGIQALKDSLKAHVNQKLNESIK
jgi:ankyrin repeat protein